MGELEYMGTVDVYGVRECMGVPFEYGGISVWLTRCGIVDFAIFLGELPEGN